MTKWSDVGLVENCRDLARLNPQTNKSVRVGDNIKDVEGRLWHLEAPIEDAR